MGGSTLKNVELAGRVDVDDTDRTGDSHARPADCDHELVRRKIPSALFQRSKGEVDEDLGKVFFLWRRSCPRAGGRHRAVTGDKFLIGYVAQAFRHVVGLKIGIGDDPLRHFRFKANPKI